MKLITEPYLEQLNRWPRSGRHILAHFDHSSVTVYQAYRPSIGLHAAKHQQFGGDFSFTRMSWIKTNFLWMMYRSGWGAKTDQEITFARDQRQYAQSPELYAKLLIPREEVYPIADSKTKSLLGVSNA
ncbi:MAG: DUF4291 family protein [Blastocatellia bacterium]|nr:DUF4291 family protein [Blastocatellia bacterium]